MREVEAKKKKRRSRWLPIANCQSLVADKQTHTDNARQNASLLVQVMETSIGHDGRTIKFVFVSKGSDKGPGACKRSCPNVSSPWSPLK